LESIKESKILASSNSKKKKKLKRKKENTKLDILKNKLKKGPKQWQKTY